MAIWEAEYWLFTEETTSNYSLPPLKRLASKCIFTAVPNNTFKCSTLGIQMYCRQVHILQQCILSSSEPFYYCLLFSASPADLLSLQFIKHSKKRHVGKKTELQLLYQRQLHSLMQVNNFISWERTKGIKCKRLKPEFDLAHLSRITQLDGYLPHQSYTISC